LKDRKGNENLLAKTMRSCVHVLHGYRNTFAYQVN